MASFQYSWEIFPLELLLADKPKVYIEEFHAEFFQLIINSAPQQEELESIRVGRELVQFFNKIKAGKIDFEKKIGFVDKKHCCKLRIDTKLEDISVNFSVFFDEKKLILDEKFPNDAKDLFGKVAFSEFYYSQIVKEWIEKNPSKISLINSQPILLSPTYLTSL